MEWWSRGVMGSPVINVAFLNYQRIDPIPGLLLSLEALNQFQQAILQFESEAIESLEIILDYLLSLAIGLQSRNRFPERS